MLVCLTIFFFFNDTATTEIYTLSLHDALPISVPVAQAKRRVPQLVPDQREVGVRLHRLLERAQRLAVALQLDQRRPLERQGERRVPELGARALGEPERIVAPPLTAQQLEALRPAALQVGMF